MTVRRGVADGDRLVVPESLDPRADRGSIAEDQFDAVGGGQALAADLHLHVQNRNAGGCSEPRPRRGDSQHGLEDIFGRNDRVQRETDHQRDNHIPDTDQAGSIDRQIDIHFTEIGRRLLAECLVDEPIGGGGIAAKRQEVDQAVLE